MNITITVKDVNGKVIPGVEVKYRSPNIFPPIDTQTTNANGVVTIKNDTWTDGWYYTFEKSTVVCPFKLAYEDDSILPMEYNIVLSPAILYFKLYKYNEDTKTEELYKQPIKVEPYRYANGNMTAETAISSLRIENDGYYYIDLRNIPSSSNSPIEYTSSYLFKITANSLTNYGSIFLLPNGFIKKRVVDWGAYPFKIEIPSGGNILPNQTMVFYPNTKRLTKAELKKCVVSNPHLMEDEKDESYCPTNITYSTIYNMIKDSNNRDNNYISGAEDINFYQNKTLTITNSTSNACNVRYYVSAPGKTRRSTLISPGASITHNIYYSANAQVKAVSEDNNYVVSPSLQTTTMNDKKTITFTCKERTFTYIIEKIELNGDTNDSGGFSGWVSARIVGSWKNNESPSTVNNLEVAVTVYDPISRGYFSFKDTLSNCTIGSTTKIKPGYKYNSIDDNELLKDVEWENGNSFYVVSIFFSSTNIYYQFKNNEYYSSGIFYPYVHPKPTNTPSQPGGGSSWGGGDYTVTVIPNGKSVECDLEDNRGNKKQETITSSKIYNVQSLIVTGSGCWKYSSDSGITDGPDADGYLIPITIDPTGRKINLELVQEW